jgi:hypothetical protein
MMVTTNGVQEDKSNMLNSRPMNYCCHALSLLVIGGLLGLAVPGRADNLLTTSASVTPNSIARGGHGTLLIVLAMEKDAHVQAHKVPDPSFIPTDFAASSAHGIRLGTPVYPTAINQTAAGIKESIYVGTATIKVPFTVTKAATPGPVSVGGSLTYQACNATYCLPPKTETLSATVTVK